jgi:TP901 family phage tail tape measure protein
MASKFEILLQARLDKSSSTEQIRADIKTLEKNLALNIPINVNTKSTNELKNSLKEVESAAKGAKEHTQGLSDIASKFSRWQIIGDVIHGVKNGIQDMVEQVFELDASLTEFRKVTDLTEDQMDSFINKSYEVAESVARTGREAIDAATEFSKAGYKEEASDLAKIALLYQNIADEQVSTSDATALIVSQMKAFNVEGKDAIKVIDQINSVSNNFAVSSAQLATAIPKVSATMAQAGNSMSETIALVTAGSEIMTGQSSRVARGLRSITLNLQGMDDEGNENLELVAAMEKDFNKLGITLYDTDGQLRSTFNIFKDLAKVYPNLDQNTKNYYASLIGGKTQVDVVNSILSNFNTALKANETAMDSSGSAMKENETYVNSLAGKLGTLNSAWEQLSQKTINSNMIKILLGIATAFLQISNAIGGLQVLFPTIASFVALWQFDKVTSGINALKTSIKGIGAYLSTLKELSKETGKSMISVFTQTMTSATKLKLSIVGIGLALSAAVAVYNIWSQAQENAKQKTQEEIDTIENAANGLEDIKKEYNEIKNSQDTEEEQKSKIIKLQERLNELYKNNNLNLYKEDLETVNKELEKLKEYKANELRSKISGQISDISDDVKKGYSSVWGFITGLFSGGTYALSDLIKTGKITGDNFFEQYDSLNKRIQENGKQIQEAIKNGDTDLQKRAEEYAKYLNKAKVQMETNGADLIQAYKNLYDSRNSGIVLTEKEVKELEQLGYNMDDYREKVGMVSKETEINTERTKEQQKAIDEVREAEEAEGAEAEKRISSLQYSSDSIKSLNEEIDNMQSAYGTLTSAIDEYNSSGSLSMETLQSLLALDGDYLNSLELVNGKLQINKQVQEEHAKKVQQDTLALIENAAIEDLKAMAAAKSGEASKSAAEQIDRAGKDAKKAGEYAAEGASGFLKLASAQAMVSGKALSQEDTEAWAKKWAKMAETATKITSGISLGSSKFTGGSKTSGSKSKSSKEVYKPEIDALYKYENALDNAKDAVDRLNDALKNTDNFNEREKYLNQLIKATKDQIKATNNLKNAQVGQINNYIKQLKKQGFQISYNSKTNQLNINNMERLGKFTGDTAKNIEKMIKKIQDLNKDNRSLDSSIRDLNADISDFNDQIKALPEEKLKKFNELMEEFQQSRLDQIQNEIEDIQHEMENDPRLKMLEEQIAALEKQNDELDSQKELEEKLLAVEEAKIKLQNAQRQKTLQVYREGQGFVYEADPDAIKEAADELQQAQNDLSDKVKQDQLDQLNAEKEALENSYQSRIDALQDFLTEQNYLIDKANREGIQTFEELQKKMAEFGLDNAENLKTATDWLNNYNKSLSDLNKTVGSILSSSTTATDGLIYSSQTQDKINSALSSIMPKIDSNTGLTLSNVRAETTDKDSNTGSIYINSIELPNVKDIDDFIAALKDLPRMASSQSTLRI